MDRRLSDCLSHRESGEYILPFFWQHGEAHEILTAELDAMERANVREFCAESRTHEKFGEDEWWEDFGFLLKEAQRRGMRVWLLDDKRFPTGYANGYVEKHPELRKTVLRADWRDMTGPRENARVLPVRIEEDERFVAIVAYPRYHSGQSFTGEPIDLTDKLRDGLIRWNIPKGNWRIYYVIRSRTTPWYRGWSDFMEPESCMAMIHGVYGPTWEHFSEYFGNTFAGFFSDEPCMGNDGNTYHSVLGTPGMPIPWRDDIPSRIAGAMGEMDPAFGDMTAEKARLLLPALFHDYEGAEAKPFRCAYMDVITRLYSENFNRLLGEWCREHGVQYIGHIIEDMNTHQRMGYGPGHFFRALQYQDMGGMDIVLHQLVPGNTEVDHAGPVCGNVLDPEFFNYLLAKLPTSQAHLTPRMKGRAMCEIFGAFGWAEGVPMMKQLADHMIANGITHYVPHAFDPKYPDADCPPHFYAHGLNPQLDAFGALMTYMRRCSHLISGGVHHAPAAVLYTAEAEWAGAEHILPQKAGKALTQNQIDFDVLWEDILPSVRAENGVLHVGEESYGALIVPWSEWFPESIRKELHRLVSEGALVLTVGREFPVEALPAYLRRSGVWEIAISPANPLVRYHHTLREDGDVWFFSSEDVFAPARFTVTMPDERTYRIYDPWTNRLFTPEQNGREIRLSLAPGGSLLLVEDDRPAPFMPEPENAREQMLSGLRVSAMESGKTEFVPIDAKIGTDITSLPGYERFAGTIRYEAEIELSGTETALFLGKVGEVASAALDGRLLGWTVCEPYYIPLENVTHGAHTLTVDVVTNLAYRERDSLSTYLPLTENGLLGPVKIG